MSLPRDSAKMESIPALASSEPPIMEQLHSLFQCGCVQFTDRAPTAIDKARSLSTPFESFVSHATRENIMVQSPQLKPCAFSSLACRDIKPFAVVFLFAVVAATPPGHFFLPFR